MQPISYQILTMKIWAMQRDRHASVGYRVRLFASWHWSAPAVHTVAWS